MDLGFFFSPLQLVIVVVLSFVLLRAKIIERASEEDILGAFLRVTLCFFISGFAVLIFPWTIPNVVVPVLRLMADFLLAVF